ncbi:hypothetical protein L6452_33756 [Arctium lappa]|uniref:Uncharacterized protein n=1 Tax=Arctium lappa TaxID=4217 RepID=A0ACB8YFQ1_ARCLA|nr:hypothetical protein L6452_33756 [Arctium lappa]
MADVDLNIAFNLATVIDFRIYRRSTIFPDFLLQFIKCYTKPWMMGFRKGFLHSSFNSPIVVLAPTPANKPQLCDFSTNNNASESFLMLNEIIIEPNQEEKSEIDEKIVITRSLFMDFSKKFEGSDSPVKVLMVNAKGN